ncbi:hypothetical protein TGME49_297910 [Toxoplasma gondii ME49]|uniref:Transmembrane protein n=2 Tax=Toxoplasma gondii TaxID=5811 RepID=S8F8G1_TOXGM|nr:hypothetical protein TGME49_297910 [Toxoplasma gondii ME49]EPT32206.1 hypothetical protein TGME49_297910 [Toxoplasma gondii ME49]KYF42418.1 hypothetical protein TGARI_297910 [Toxoplasma gondii ARI]|eukprot:XP_002371211.1 hypothetical protein TGME49_297910 [Toxoplasma gondii ME49]
MTELQKAQRRSNLSAVMKQGHLRFWAVLLVCALVSGCGAASASHSSFTASQVVEDESPPNKNERINPSGDVDGHEEGSSPNVSQVEKNRLPDGRTFGGSGRDLPSEEGNQQADLSSSTGEFQGSRARQHDDQRASSSKRDDAGSEVNASHENVIAVQETEAVDRARDNTFTKRPNPRKLAAGFYPGGMTATPYGAYLNWYRTAYLPWYYTTFGTAASAPVLTSPAVYSSYYPTVAATVAAAPVQAAFPVVQQAVAEQGPINVVQPAIALSQRATVPVVQQSAVPVAVPGRAALAPVAVTAPNPVVTTTPTEALLSLEEPANGSGIQQLIAPAPVALLAAPYATGNGNSRGSRANSRYSDGVGGLGLSNFAAFLARPDGTLAAIGGNGT